MFCRYCFLYTIRVLGFFKKVMSVHNKSGWGRAEPGHGREERAAGADRGKVKYGTDGLAIGAPAKQYGGCSAAGVWSA